MIKRMEHVGIVVDDIAAATEFFVELGLELERYENSYRLGYGRGPESIIVELAEQIS
jgi:catechol 2,3-dioxygenase-like lactoylglutathione lyase family enzyme